MGEWSWLPQFRSSPVRRQAFTQQLVERFAPEKVILYFFGEAFGYGPKPAVRGAGIQMQTSSW